jgi:peptidoglycan/LPS O-acetylase OafA/YrhL
LKKVIGCRTARFCLISAGIFWLIVQAASVALDAFQLHPAPLYWMYFPLFHLASFLVGIATCEWHLRREVSSTGSDTLIPFLISVVGLVCCLKGIESAPQTLRQAGWTSLFALPFAWVVVSVARLPAGVVDALDRPWIRMMGKISFPVYLLQVPVFKVFDRLLIQPCDGVMTIPLFLAYLGLLFIPSILWITIAESLLLAKLRPRRT